MLGKMLYTLISYLRFQRTCANAHGIHSPFVFQFVTKCLYAKKRWSTNKSLNVLLKSIAYFNSSHVCVLDDLEAAEKVMESFPKVNYNSAKFDVLFAHQFNTFHFHQLLAEGKLHNDSVILVGHIHQNPMRYKEWKSLIEEPNITVSIDMYHLGALFIRREQEKEHFTVRI